jgi:hypothetical protein
MGAVMDGRLLGDGVLEALRDGTTITGGFVGYIGIGVLGGGITTTGWGLGWYDRVGDLERLRDGITTTGVGLYVLEDLLLLLVLVADISIKLGPWIRRTG